MTRIDALQGQAMVQERGGRLELELKKIVAALQCIEKGDYDLCLKCDEPIAQRRLEFDPAIIQIDPLSSTLSRRERELTGQH